VLWAPSVTTLEHPVLAKWPGPRLPASGAQRRAATGNSRELRFAPRDHRLRQLRRTSPSWDTRPVLWAPSVTTLEHPVLAKWPGPRLPAPDAQRRELPLATRENSVSPRVTTAYDNYVVLHYLEILDLCCGHRRSLRSNILFSPSDPALGSLPRTLNGASCHWQLARNPFRPAWPPPPMITSSPVTS